MSRFRGTRVKIKTGGFTLGPVYVFTHTHAPNREGWMEEEAKTFVKVVQATDPQAPCPKCVTEDHNICSTSLRSVWLYHRLS